MQFADICHFRTASGNSQCRIVVGGSSAMYSVAMGGGRPLSSFGELLSMAVLTASW